MPRSHLLNRIITPYRVSVSLHTAVLSSFRVRPDRDLPGREIGGFTSKYYG